jgi:hypothetical protein
MGDMRNVYNILATKFEGKKLLGRLKGRCEDNNIIVRVELGAGEEVALSGLHVSLVLSKYQDSHILDCSRHRSAIIKGCSYVGTSRNFPNGDSVHKVDVKPTGEFNSVQRRSGHVVMNAVNCK